MEKNNCKNVAKKGEAATSNGTWKRYKSANSSKNPMLKDPSLDEKVNIEGFTNWISNQTQKKNK
jgi:hypothetical protein